MNWKTIEKVAENSDKQWYLNQKEVGILIGQNRKQTAIFLSERSVPYYCVAKAKKYFLPEVLEAVEKTRWKSGAAS